MTKRNYETLAKSLGGCQVWLRKKSLTRYAFFLELWSLLDQNFVYIFQHVNIAEKKIQNYQKIKKNQGYLLVKTASLYVVQENQQLFLTHPISSGKIVNL